MKLAFSSAACPAWDLATMVQKAKQYGYAGIELRGLTGQMHLPVVPEIASDPEKIGRLTREAGVEIVCLSTGAAFHMRDRREVVTNQAEVRETIELAERLECPYVRVFGAEIPKVGLLGYERREVVLGRIASAIQEIAPEAAARGVTILIENSGDFVDSASMWYLMDAIDSPSVKCCWSPFAARSRHERPTISIPRLGGRLGLVHVCDGRFHPNGALDKYVLPGQGEVEIPKLIQLLKGVGYHGPLVFDWPKLWNPTLTDPDKALPAAAEFLQPLIDERPVVLTAYKGDKFVPRQGYEHVQK